MLKPRKAIMKGVIMTKEMFMKHLEKKYVDYITNVFSKEIGRITKELGLSKVPTLELEGYADVDGDSSAVMYVKHFVTYEPVNFLENKITKVITDYVVHVNVNNTMRKLLSCKMMCGSKIAEYDALKFLFAHECRHIWQAQNGFQVGNKVNTIIVNIEPHGNKPTEKDANNWAIKYCSKKDSSKLLAEMLTEEQNQEVFCTTSQKLIDTTKRVTNSYNPTWGAIINRFTNN